MPEFKHSASAAGVYRVFCLQDTTSFLAGERAALARAFRETLPSQQALGALSSGIKQVLYNAL